MLIWHNVKKYNLDTISNRIAFIKSNMNGMFPPYGKEMKNIKIYAQKNYIPVYEVMSIRNTIKVQEEIDSSKKIHKYLSKIKFRFIQLSNKHPNNASIKNFLQWTKMPIQMIIKIIGQMPEYQNLSDINIQYLSKINKLIYQYNQIIHHRSRQFEIILENYLAKEKIKFKTEIDIKKSGYTVTPDILFDEPINIVVDGTQHTIYWMDAKNYILIDTPFIIKSLNKQASKYHSAFGLGAFVFHYGYDCSIVIPNVLILDGSFLDEN